MDTEVRPLEARIFDAVSKYKRKLEALQRIEDEKVNLAKVGRRDGSLFDILQVHVDAARGLGAEICQSLPPATSISSEDRVVWSGHLSDLQFDFLNGNTFIIRGQNSIVAENDYHADDHHDNVSVVVSKAVATEASLNKSVESLFGIEVKIFRLDK